MPEIAERTEGEPTPTAREIIVSSHLADEGIEVGDIITLDRLETELEVTAFADGQRTFGHVDMGYVPLDVWQEAHAGVRAGEAAHEHAYGEASVVVVQGTPTGTSTASTCAPSRRACSPRPATAPRPRRCP